MKKKERVRKLSLNLFIILFSPVFVLTTLNPSAVSFFKLAALGTGGIRLHRHQK
jgi:hypothetical protein